MLIPVPQLITQDVASDAIMVSKHLASRLFFFFSRSCELSFQFTILNYTQQTSSFYIQTLMYMPVNHIHFDTNLTMILTSEPSVACRLPSLHSRIVLKYTLKV